MQAELPAGKYVVAVSGGVDSVVLLDLLVAAPAELELVVAHFDHGIRPDSAEDAAFVRELAKRYGLEFRTERAELGKGASEAVARQARYEFLHRVKNEIRADAIVTAHHQDDVLETMLLNLVRGTKWRGLQSLKSTDDIRRPLLGYSKARIRDYAKAHDLPWHEDSTNADPAILRNYLRHTYVAKLTTPQREAFLHIRDRCEQLTTEIDTLVKAFWEDCPPKTIPRGELREFSDEVAREILAGWLRREADGVEVTSAMLSRLLDAVRHGRNGSLIDIKRGYSLKLQRNEAVLILPHQK